jgi:NarL family two-component system response regulator LiaR
VVFTGFLLRFTVKSAMLYFTKGLCSHMKEKIKILLAEDHVVVRQSLRQFLNRVNTLEVVGEAGDGEEAVELAKKLKPDVVVMDIAMPRLNGIQATRLIKEMLPATAVLALSAYDFDHYIFTLLEAGASGYLLKDADGQELIEAIEAVYRGESVLYPTIARRVVERFRKSAIKPGDDKKPDFLSEREITMLKQAATGMSNKEIASEAALSLRTVEANFGSIFTKLGVGSRTEAVVYGLKRGLFTMEELPLK